MTTMNATTTVTAAAVEGYEAIPMPSRALDTPDSGATARVAASDLHSITDVVVLEGVSHNSSHVSALLKRYAWRALLALISIITAIAVLVGQAILAASLTNTDSIISNVQAEVQSIVLATNGGAKGNSSSSAT
jgi:hypothetical protein